MLNSIMEHLHSISVTLFALTISFDSISLTFLEEILRFI